MRYICSDSREKRAHVFEEGEAVVVSGGAVDKAAAEVAEKEAMILGQKVLLLDWISR